MNPNCKPSLCLISPPKKITTQAGPSRSQRALKQQHRQHFCRSAAESERRQTTFVQIHSEFLRFAKDWQAGRRSKRGHIPVYWVHLSEHLKTSIMASEEGGLRGASCCSLTKKKFVLFCVRLKYSALLGSIFKHEVCAQKVSHSWRKLENSTGAFYHID